MRRRDFMRYGAAGLLVPAAYAAPPGTIVGGQASRLYGVTGGGGEPDPDPDPDPGGGDQFDIETLVTGDDGVAYSGPSGFSHDWTSDETGDFLRLQWTTSGTKGARVAFPAGVRECYFEYEIRRHSVYGTKQMKIRHENNGGANYSNATFGGTGGGYQGGTYVIYYGEGASGPNDQLQRIYLDDMGNQSRSPIPTLAVTQSTSTAYTQSYDGTWEKIAWWHKFNDPEVPNGEFAMWKWVGGSRVLLVWAHSLWNCIDAGGDMGLLGIGEYAHPSYFPEGGITEDYRNLRILFSRPEGAGI